MNKLHKKVKIKTELELITGMHIGGGSDNIEIGGLDSPVIKMATKEKQPYLPGSSLKGKVRSLLEQISGISSVGQGNIKQEEKSIEAKEINNFFGFANDNKPSKLIVRDAYLTKESLEQLSDNDYLDMPYTENKYENVIDRATGVTKRGGLRNSERIPAGVSFDVEFVINVWESDGDGSELVDLLKKGIKALENDYLGGSGSRGYGQVKFGELKFEEISFENYLKGN